MPHPRGDAEQHCGDEGECALATQPLQGKVCGSEAQQVRQYHQQWRAPEQLQP
jgi:hypothetical protein